MNLKPRKLIPSTLNPQDDDILVPPLAIALGELDRFINTAGSLQER
ncbi:MAG: hypothetical protein WBL40_16070 [Terrimicrobiaceae bacterium]